MRTHTLTSIFTYTGHTYLKVNRFKYSSVGGIIRMSNSADVSSSLSDINLTVNGHPNQTSISSEVVKGVQIEIIPDKPPLSIFHHKPSNPTNK